MAEIWINLIGTVGEIGVGGLFRRPSKTRNTEVRRKKTELTANL